MTETREVHFGVEGEFITQTARDLMLSEDPARAYRLISRGLMGEGVEAAAIGILEGRQKLTGINELELVDDDNAESYLKSVSYIYAGRIRVRGSWWRPVATIGLYGPASARWASIVDQTMMDALPWEVMRAWADRRATYFCGPRERLQYDRENKRYVIWEPCGERPFWWDVAPDEKAALTEFEDAGRQLEVRGEGISDTAVMRGIRRSPDIIPEQADAAQEAYDAAQQAIYDTLLRDMGRQVMEQAGDDTFELAITEDYILTVARAPFWHWALDNTELKHLAPPWKPISKSGMKLPLDNEYHTDWMLGAGLNLDKDYRNEDIRNAAYAERFRLQEALGGFESAVLVDNGRVDGTVGIEVVVVPDLSQRYAEPVMRDIVRAVITERGGAMAHIANVGRETGLTIMRVENAVKMFPKGTRVSLLPTIGKVKERV